MNIEIQYIKNKNNVIADGFSRIIYKNPKCAIYETVKKIGCGNNQIQKWQDMVLENKKNWIQKHAFAIQ